MSYCDDFDAFSFILTCFGFFVLNSKRCDSGRCIPKSWQCDGEYDCPTREDEPTSCRSDDRKCSDPDHFR